MAQKITNSRSESSHQAFFFNLFGMWYLVYSVYANGKEQSTTTALFPGKSYSVGKKDAQILIMHDNSISKKHVTFTVGPYAVSKLEDIYFKPVISLTAHKTTYGTRVNGDLLKGSSSLLQDSVIQLGSLGFYMRLRWKNVVVCRNAAKSFEKKKLAKAAIRSGFTILRKWDERCTHLYMTDLIVSDRLIYALISNKPIVSDKWLDKLVEKGNVDEADKEIEPIYLENYGPLKKQVVLTYNPSREELFEGIEFWIYSKEQVMQKMNHFNMANDLKKYDRLEFLIKLCQGSASIMNLDGDVDLTGLKETTLIIQPPEEMVGCDRWIALEMQFCNNHGFIRSIQEHELIYSILYCSTNTLCNPKTPYPFEKDNYTKPCESQSISEKQSSKSTRRAACLYSQNDAHSEKPSYQSSCSLSNNNTVAFSPPNSLQSTSEADTVMFNPPTYFNNTVPPSGHKSQESNSLPELCDHIENPKEAIDESKDLERCNVTSSLIPSVNQFFDDFLGVLDSHAPDSLSLRDEKHSKAPRSFLTDQKREPNPPSLSAHDINKPSHLSAHERIVIQSKTSLDSQYASAVYSPEPDFHDLFDMGSPIEDCEQAPESHNKSLSRTLESNSSQTEKPLSLKIGTTYERTTQSDVSPQNTDSKIETLNSSLPSEQVVFVSLIKRPYNQISQTPHPSTEVNYKKFQKTNQLCDYGSSDVIHISCPVEPRQNKRGRNYRLTTDEVDNDIAIRTNLRR